jgi:hypothetical protein
MSLFKSILAQAICTTTRINHRKKCHDSIMVLTIHQCLLNLILCVHHERTVLHDLLIKWLSCNLCVASCISIRRFLYNTRNNSYQDEIGVTLYGGNRDTCLLATRGQNKRMERIVCYARVADIDLPIHGCKKYLNQLNSRYSRIETYCR